MSWKLTKSMFSWSPWSLPLLLSAPLSCVDEAVMASKAMANPRLL